MNNYQHLAKQNYKIINLCLATIILLIFIYSGLFSPKESKHPIPSFYTQITNKNSPSTGLSRSFSAIIRGNLKLSKTYNPYALPIFLFFALQFIFRVFSIFIIREKKPLFKLYLFIDITLSISGFYLAFRPLILFTLKLFQETIVNC